MAETISVSAEGARLVYNEKNPGNADIWRIDGPASTERNPPTRMIASSRLDWGQEYSPDGSRIAFASERQGSNNIWLCDSDGTNCSQLTEMERADGPTWSPDGKSVAYNASHEGNTDVYVVDVEGGFTRRLTHMDTTEQVGSWSHDGRWIYFSTIHSRGAQVWKIPAEGGQPIQITKMGGLNPQESDDGRFLYYADKPSGATIRRVPVDGGDEMPVMEELINGFQSFDLWGKSIVYITQDEQKRQVLRHFDLKTRQVTELFSFDPGRGPGSFTVSPDGRWVLVALFEPTTSDIMLVENFR
jgi:Tol biopolymer transport system component